MKNKRKYVRISTVFPVEFSVFDKEGKRITPWLQGFTHDISKGGICLLINDLWWGFWDKFNFTGAQLLLKIEIPFGKKILSAKARVIWTDQEKLESFNQYIVGLDFTEVETKPTDILFKYALFKKFLPVFIGALTAILILLSFSLLWKTTVLVKENKKLIKTYVEKLKVGSALENALLEEKKRGLFLKKRKEEIVDTILSKEEELVELQEKYRNYTEVKNIEQASSLKERIFILEKELAALKREGEFIKNKEKEKQDSFLSIEMKVKNLEKERMGFSKKVVEGAYVWIKNRQDLLSGLVLSYEGDRNLEKVCFTYDQALATVVFLLFDEKERAAKILNFYLDKTKKNENIYNAYYTKGDVFECCVHSGPNAWIGIAALNYIKETNDKTYLELAQRIADFLLNMMDKEGGIRGGPQEDWYATEHNLDAFAFFNLLYELTKDEKYLKTAQKIRGWLSRYSYTQYGPPIKRGKGDSTIATDTYAWSITALGPELLVSLNMNPQAILEFAFENCEVKTIFSRLEGDVMISGFDFAKFKNMPRGGVVSCEWTSQMILSLEIMADYYKNRNSDKYNDYLQKAVFYFNELQKMLITSLSRVGREDPCLPYASTASVDTGHGWRTPQGDRTGSLAATSYFLIAYFGYNPLQANFLKISLKEIYEQGTYSAYTESN